MNTASVTRTLPGRPLLAFGLLAGAASGPAPEVTVMTVTPRDTPVQLPASWAQR